MFLALCHKLFRGIRVVENDEKGEEIEETMDLLGAGKEATSFVPRDRYVSASTSAELCLPVKVYVYVAVWVP